MENLEKSATEFGFMPGFISHDARKITDAIFIVIQLQQKYR